MSTSALDQLKKQAEELEAKARTLPQQPGRDQLLRDVQNFRKRLAHLVEIGLKPMGSR